MQSFSEYFEILVNSEKLIHYGGFALLLIVIFAETGLVFGIIFPGDALLVTAGILCGSDLTIDLWLLVTTVALAAVAGNITGYATGYFLGNKLESKADTLFFKRKYLTRSKHFYEKYGGVALIAGRFLPVVRTFIPILAGTIRIDFWNFTLFNLAGAVLWAGTLIPLGYFVGRKIPSSVDNLEYIVLGITLVTMTVMVRGIIRFRRHHRGS
ncbi:MAG TPA: DedA family protein [Bacteroidales bacterium]|nr:DedA family protein [Bacteroidales bacterium]